MLRIYFQEADLSRVRVAKAPDPLWETVLGLYRLGADAAGPPVFARWQRQAKAAVHEQRLHGAVGLLRDLVPRVGYFPDFLTPAEAGTGLSEGLAALRDTPGHRLAHDLRYAARTRRLSTWTGRLADGDRDVLDELVDAVASVHRTVVRPVWDDIEAAVGVERSLRGAALLDGGVEAMLSTLRPVLRWDPPVLSADYPTPLDLHLDGRGLLLIPSYFCWGKPVTLADPTLRPVLVYPVEHPPTWLDGVAGTRAGALEALLGRTRAAVMAALVVPSTSTELSARLGISTASASEHVGVLRDAGLVVSHRSGRTVQHALTPVALAVLGQSFRT
ncbi:winged helix-turn-helix domain-containing protein [Actinophytocola oryzae]|uniref:DNA-binding transcriptional ArsR family regulator n=1 Tax=Actinophytocola oryzae TaxID=502181 RepID=A0A4R7VI46_9PSEU|nr:winged helix-turn-helix domain-containing protein [Actinophytocola oryzae]TDV48847.1 DNA-binding transcriptional ArsR family regulator [Actinophytocola oryzae]